MTLEVKRSPAKVCWHVICNGSLIVTRSTKRAAEEVANSLAKRYGLEVV